MSHIRDFILVLRDKTINSEIQWDFLANIIADDLTSKETGYAFKFTEPVTSSQTLNNRSYFSRLPDVGLVFLLSYDLIEFGKAFRGFSLYVCINGGRVPKCLALSNELQIELTHLHAVVERQISSDDLKEVHRVIGDYLKQSGKPISGVIIDGGVF